MNKQSNDTSFCYLLRDFHNCPSSLALFFDSEISLLLDSASLGVETGRMLGEALFRDWLYGRHCPSRMVELLDRHLGKDRLALLRNVMTPYRHGQAFNSSSLPSFPAADAKPLEEIAWQHAVARVRDMLKADGLVAVVGSTNDHAVEAVAIPFFLAVGENDVGAVRDRSGQVVDHWTYDLARLREWFGPVAPRMVLSTECGRRAGSLVGGSFALPVLLAAARRQGYIGEYCPLSVLATGALETGGVLAGVQGIAAKRQLANRLDCRLFVCCCAPEETDRYGADFLWLPPGLAVENLADTLVRHLDDVGLTKLDVYQAYQRVKSLQQEIHEGLVPLAVAVRRIDRYEPVFVSNLDAPQAQEGKLYVQLLRGALANHTGNPESGRQHTQQAADLASKLRNPQLYVDATASLVVSLTDLGLLDEAEIAGRDLSHWVENEFFGSATDRINCQMVAAGVLGGQPLLQKGLNSDTAKDESLQHIKDAIKYAQQARLPSEIARDLVQLALWYALHNPLQALIKVEEVEKEISSFGRDSETSGQYLNNYRFLAAYRCFLLGMPISADFKACPLPKEPNWLIALTRKYRGALYAATGDPKHASKDFVDAWKELDAENRPLLRFIGATAALQAGESMRPFKGARWKEHLQCAQETFNALEGSLFGVHRDNGWQVRASGLLAEKKVAALPNPQLFYRY